MGKFEFYKENLEFPGFNISKAGLRPNHKHTEAVRTYPAPQNEADIACFTGHVNFFWSCIPKAAKLMQSLTDLMLFFWGANSKTKLFRTQNKLWSTPPHCNILAPPPRSSSSPTPRPPTSEHSSKKRTMTRDGRKWLSTPRPCPKRSETTAPSTVSSSPQCGELRSSDTSSKAVLSQKNRIINI